MDYKKRAEKIIFCILLFFGACFHHPVEYDNTASRYFLVSAVVDFGTFNIDPYHRWTIDQSFYGGHYYSNKAIGAPLLGIPVYGVTRKILIPDNSLPLTEAEKYAIRIVTTTLPFALLGIILFRMACLLGASPRRALWVVLAYSFGSIALIHATLFSGHQTAASFAFFSFFLLFRLAGRTDSPDPSSLQSLITSLVAGIFAGIAALADYTAIFIALVLSVYALLSRMSWKYKALFLSGGLICAMVLAGYNWTCFGSPWSFSYSHLSFGAFRDGAAKGVLGISFPNPAALLSILASPSRGLFFIMPVFLFSLTGFRAMWNHKMRRPETAVLLVIVVGYFLINAGFYAWHGGWTFGPRYLVPMLPFLVLPMVFSPWDSKAFLLLFAVSLFQVIPAVVGFPHAPQEIKNPVVELILPCMGYGYLAFNPLKWNGSGELYLVVAVMLITAGTVFLAFRRLPSDETADRLSPLTQRLMVVWVLAIIVVLSVQRTAPSTLVHYYRSRILLDAATVTRSVELQRKGVEEGHMAGLNRRKDS